jgi:hypothetical protein
MMIDMCTINTENKTHNKLTLNLCELINKKKKNPAKVCPIIQNPKGDIDV